MIREKIIEMVENLLEKLTYEVHVVAQGVRQDHDWWHVPVHAEKEPEQQWQYYEDLTNIESMILENNDLKILLIPVS